MGSFFNLNKSINTLLFTMIIIFTSCNSTENKMAGNTAVTNNQNDSGWTSLFDGKTTSGWHTYGKHIAGNAWKAGDSILHLDASVKNGWQTMDGGDIVTNNEFDNFDLKLDWKISGGGNSGIMFYVHEDTSKYKYPWESGPELQVADNEKNEDGKIYKSRCGDLYELAASTSPQYLKPAGQWNTQEIIAYNGKIDEYLNGNHVLSVTLWKDEWKKLIDSTKFKTMPGFGTYKKGSIALQDHGADIWFRNIRIKKL